MRMIIPLLMSDKGPPPAHPLSAGRKATPSHSLEVRSPVCVLTRAGLPGLTSTYSGGWNDYSNYGSSVGLDRLSSLL